LLHVLFFSWLFIIFCLFVFWEAGISMSRALCWFLSGEVVGELCATYSTYCSPVGLPTGLGAGAWRHRSPLGFSLFCDVGDLCAGWGCGGAKFCLFLVVIPVQCFSGISGKFLL
jgi:hypothetical protein